MSCDVLGTCDLIFTCFGKWKKKFFYFFHFFFIFKKNSESLIPINKVLMNLSISSIYCLQRHLHLHAVRNFLTGFSVWFEQNLSTSFSVDNDNSDFVLYRSLKINWNLNFNSFNLLQNNFNRHFNRYRISEILINL